MEAYLKAHPLLVNGTNTTINGTKTDKANLGNIAADMVMVILTKNGKLTVQQPFGLEVVCRGLHQVWDWPEDTKETFWNIFISLVGKLRELWRLTQFPGEVPIDSHNPVTWNVITWYV